MRAVTVSFRIGQGVCDVTRASGVGGAEVLASRFRKFWRLMAMGGPNHRRSSVAHTAAVV